MNFLTRITLHKCKLNPILIVGLNFQNFKVYFYLIIQLLPNFCASKNQTFLEKNEEITQKQCTKVCKNVTHTISIFTSEYMMNQNILWQDLLLILLVRLLFYKQTRFLLVFHQWKRCFSSNIGVQQFQQFDWMIPLATRFSQNQSKRCRENPEERRGNSPSHKSICDGMNS